MITLGTKEFWSWLGRSWTWVTSVSIKGFIFVGFQGCWRVDCWGSMFIGGWFDFGFVSARIITSRVCFYPMFDSSKSLIDFIAALFLFFSCSNVL